MRKYPLAALTTAVTAVLLFGCSGNAAMSEVRLLRTIDERAANICMERYLPSEYSVDGAKLGTLDEVRTLLEGSELGAADPNLDEDLPGSTVAAICVLSGDSIEIGFGREHMAVYMLQDSLGDGFLDVW